MRRKGDGLFLELAQAVVDWALAHRNTVSVTIGWRLMVIAMQVHLFVRPLGLPKRIERGEVAGLRMSFNRDTRQPISNARGVQGICAARSRTPHRA